MTSASAAYLTICSITATAGLETSAASTVLMPNGYGHSKLQGVVIQTADHRRALLLIDVHAKPQVAAQTVAGAGPVGRHVIDAVGDRDDRVDAVHVSQPLIADPALQVEWTI